MKKLLLFTTICLFSILTVVAQPKAIGGRLGTTLELSYQHNIGNNTFAQFDLGFPHYNGIQVSGVYNWIFASPNWTSKGTWEWYGGIGAGLGYSWYYYNTHTDLGVSKYNYFFLGVAGMVGVSYTFWFPLQLSLDIKPIIGPKFGRHYVNGIERNVSFNPQGLIDIALGVRYSF